MRRRKRFPYNKYKQRLYHVAEKGDILDFSGVNFVSRGIQLAQDSMWNHGAIYVGGHEIVEAVASGVVENPLDDYFDNKTTFIVRRVKGITVDQVAAMMQKIYVGPDKLIGHKYDYMQIVGALFHIIRLGWIAKNHFDRPNLDICTEVVDKACEAAGIDIAPHLQDIRDPYPKDLAISEVMETVVYLNPIEGVYEDDKTRLARFDNYAYQHEGNWP